MSIGVYFIAVLFSFLGNAGVSLFNSNLYGTGPAPEEYSRIAWKDLRTPFLLLSLAFAYMGQTLGQTDLHAQDVISKWITPYPSITSIIHAPNPHHEFIWSRIMGSNDPPKKVYSFYEDESHYVGWEKEKKGSFIIFTKPDYSLEISASDKAGSGNTIFYTLKKLQMIRIKIFSQY